MDEDIVLDPEHPWIGPAIDNQPTPVPTAMAIQAVNLTVNDKTMPAALVTTVTPAGIQTVYLNPRQLQVLLQQAAEALQDIAAQAQQGLTVVKGNVNMEKFAQDMQNLRKR